jgi:hypothetical protein
VFLLASITDIIFRCIKWLIKLSKFVGFYKFSWWRRERMVGLFVLEFKWRRIWTCTWYSWLINTAWMSFMGVPTHEIQYNKFGFKHKALGCRTGAIWWWADRWTRIMNLFTRHCVFMFLSSCNTLIRFLSYKHCINKLQWLQKLEAHLSLNHSPEQTFI